MAVSLNSTLKKGTTHPLVWIPLKRWETKSAENVQSQNTEQRSFRNDVSEAGHTLEIDESLQDIPIPIFLRFTRMLRNGTH